MRSRVRLLSSSASFLLAALLLIPSAQAEVKPYPACERDPTENDVSAAKGAYEAGQVSFQEADYERSLLYWEDAFRRDCTAVKLLLNIARAYELSGERESAVNALQTYLDRRPDASDRDSVEKRIEKLKEKIAEEKKDAVAAAPVEEPAEKEPAAEEEKPASSPAPESDDSHARKPLWPIFVTGGGIVVALVGHGLYNQGDELRNDEAERLGCDLEQNECPSDEIRDQANEAGQTERTNGTIVAVTGHLIGITGGVLWWYFWSRGTTDDSAALTKPRTALTPIVAPGYQGLNFSSSF